MNVPMWFIELHYEGCPQEAIQEAWAEYRECREEGYSQEYVLVRVLGLKDPS